jgi:hypothetical protein
MRTVTVRACLFTVFSFVAAFLWPFKPDLIPNMPFTPVVWFSCIGMIALSISRFYGVRHAVPAPELYIFLYTIVLVLFINHLPYPVRALDTHLLFFDYNFGYFGVVIGRMYRESSFFGALLGLTYNSLMLAVTAIYLVLPNTPVRRRFIVAVVLAGTIILPLYLVCPAAGPKYLFGDRYSWWIPDLSGPPTTVHIPIATAFPNGMNAIPSGHFAWALLSYWFARKYCSKGVRVASGVYAVLTSLATLGTGEHYVVDLVVSVPFAAAIWNTVHRQWRFAGIGLGVVLAWLIALREAWALAIPPLPAWLLIASTIAFFALRVADGECPADNSAGNAPRVRSTPELHKSYT